MSIFSDFIVEICVGMFFLFSRTTFISEFLDKLFLELSCCFDIFSRFFIRAVIKRALLLQVKLIE